MCILISCEAGGDEVPQHLVSPLLLNRRAEASAADNRDTEDRKLRRSQRQPGKLPPSLSYDGAARYASRRMAERLRAPIIENQYALELVDVTRSLHHRYLHSPTTRHWAREERQRLIDDIYIPYRNRVTQTLSQMLDRYSYVVHLSVRSFDLMGPKKKRRRADVGLLYDASVTDEVDLCADWLEELYFEVEMLKVRRNYPRRGTVDSLPKAMRTRFREQYYIGVEVLLNRAWASREVRLRDEAIDGLCDQLQMVLQLTAADLPDPTVIAA